MSEKSINRNTCKMVQNILNNVKKLFFTYCSSSYFSLILLCLTLLIIFTVDSSIDFFSGINRKSTSDDTIKQGK